MQLRIQSLFSKDKMPQRPAIKREKMIIIYSIALLFVLSTGVRLLAGNYGFYINEFDPYFQYHSTNYIVNSFDQKGIGGLLDYFNWVDKMSWYPEGRDVASTSFSGLHYIGALSYITLRNVFGLNISLYDYLVLLPVFIGGLISIAAYFLGKEIDGEATGIFAGIITAISPPLVSRDSLGWWDTEPIAFLFGIVALLLFISLIKEDKTKLTNIVKASIAGILLGLSMTIWGGAMYFVGTIGVVLLIALFFVKSYKTLFEHTIILLVLNLLISMMFKKPGYTVLLNAANLVIYVGLISCLILSIRQKGTYNVTKRDIVYSVLMSLLIGLTVVGFGMVGGLTRRYLSVLLPFERSQDPIVESVAEHASSTSIEFFAFFTTILFFAGFSIYYILRKPEFKKIASIGIAAAALYFAASFARLMIYLSFSLSILAGIGIIVITRALLVQPTQLTVKRKGGKPFSNTDLKMVFMAFFIIVMVFSSSIWIRYADAPVSLATGSVGVKTPSSDWVEALTFIRENTPDDSVIISWWDYGYWIRVIGNKTTLVDNATLNTTKIALVGQMFLSSEEDSIKVIKDLAPNKENVYVVVFVVAYQQLQQGYYLLGGGGEESKFYWMASIAGLNQTLYYDSSSGAGTSYFWDNTLLGKMIPFTPTVVTYNNQYITAYASGLKIDSKGDGYFELVFSSSFKSYAQVLVYKLKT